MIANTPEPPYYAVIFTTVRTEDDNSFSAMSQELEELAKDQPGFLGMESIYENYGITVSYWTSLEAIKNWKENSLHLHAQQLGKSKWYSHYKTRICKVERDYGV